MRNKQFGWMILVCMYLLSTVVAAQDSRPLTNQDVIKMVKAGLPENTIVLAIQKSSNKFDISPDALISLQEVGATQKVLEAILQAKPSSTSGSVNVQATPSSGQGGGGVTSVDLKIIDKQAEAEFAALFGIEQIKEHLPKRGDYKATGTETIVAVPSSTGAPPSIVSSMIRIKIESIDQDGKVKAEVMRTQVNKPDMKGHLEGKIDAQGMLQLEGFIVDKNKWEFTLTAIVEGKALTKGQYRFVSYYVYSGGIIGRRGREVVVPQQGYVEVRGKFDKAVLEEDN